ncbi:acyltransferase [Bifidobacterium felsineum]|uniref:Galactoside O-acetyltransferase n=1 Tax=Bifidobacterium felsineum TaxID=2045440 RepID=A0A2M9HHZ1_9BIFI|nr:acyltransferase [Bifidobacterium felsineum]PJM76409.1 galactoside O-acetyltransferase [Bifidobacterium felsineum]
MTHNITVTGLDKWIVLWRTGVKAIRGLLRKPFLKKSCGLLLIGRNVTISHANHILCGRNVKFEDYSEIHGLCSEGLTFGNDVTIGRGVMIRPSSYYGGDCGQGLVMGDNSSIGPHSFIGCSGHITIGSNVMIGPKCSMFAENHVFTNTSETIKSQGVKHQNIVIGDDCWIGSNVIILAGVTIGSGCVIGAGTIITKDIPAYSIVIDKLDKSVKSRRVS